MCTGESQDHSTVPPTLEGRTTQSDYIKTIVLQLQNDFALLLYLLFSSVGTTSISRTSVKNSVISPPNILNPNPKPTSKALPNLCANEPSVRRSTPEGAVGSPRTKTTTSASIGSHSSPNTREAPLTLMQNLTSRTSKLANLITD